MLQLRRGRGPQRSNARHPRQAHLPHVQHRQDFLALSRRRDHSLQQLRSVPVQRQRRCFCWWPCIAFRAVHGGGDISHGHSLIHGAVHDTGGQSQAAGSGQACERTREGGALGSERGEGEEVIGAVERIELCACGFSRVGGFPCCCWYCDLNCRGRSRRRDEEKRLARRSLRGYSIAVWLHRSIGISFVPWAMLEMKPIYFSSPRLQSNPV